MSLFQILLNISGGLGLFLLGMTIMTDGLRALAAENMRRILTRFTRSPYSGAITGALTTAVLQSSSATTVAAVGFVGAGLLTFSQSLGIIFGANIGTTITGWLVALLGLKLQLGSLMLPLVLLGALVKLFARNHLQQMGFALAGFGLVFIGISMLQAGMGGLESDVIPLNLPADSWMTRLQFIGLGILFTVITQSSSAGVAATLTALYAGTIDFHHAASLVIGMDIGTTFTAAIASIGGSSAMRRTGLSHVIYNLLTGIMALLLITPYMYIVEHGQGDILSNAELYLVAFHSGFNVLGVILVIPFTQQFSLLMLHLIPDRKDPLSIGLDNSLLKEPSVAITASHAVLSHQFQYLLQILLQKAERHEHIDAHSLQQFQQSMSLSQSYVDRIHLSQEDKPQWQRLYGITHALEHLQRFYHRMQKVNSISIAYQSPQLRELVTKLSGNIHRLNRHLMQSEWQDAAQLTSSMALDIAQQTDILRDQFIANVASDTLDVPVANEYLHALRWLNRVSTHIERISFYLSDTAYPLSKSNNPNPLESSATD
ncbi:MAG: Na/Pi symporter [Gammaproteobacteria bacterium]|nr:Na/Pi symporter [Gammaproteobacteria bacterium]